jgi:hypothetical protein
MPAYGIIPDSAAGYYAGKAYRAVKRSGSKGSRARAVSVVFRTTTSDVTFKFKKVVIYDWALNLELHTPSGGLWKDLERRSAMAVHGAKAQAGFRTGALKKSIKHTHTSDRLGQTVKIGSSLSYAYLHHNGSKPHIIKPKVEGGVLVFTSNSRVVRAKTVMHPGTRPNPYLSNQLRHFRY